MQGVLNPALVHNEKESWMNRLPVEALSGMLPN
jgi:hypothetical protein